MANPKVFACGRRGQSLVVWAIREGRQAAHAVDKLLMGSTALPRLSVLQPVIDALSAGRFCAN